MFAKKLSLLPFKSCVIIARLLGLYIYAEQMAPAADMKKTLSYILFVEACVRKESVYTTYGFRS
jgi:hypothetical protein